VDLIELDIIVLFGGFQALSLCFYLLFRKTDNKKAHRFFLLFLLCLAIHNLGYAALFRNFEIGAFNMGMHPIPYKYIIAPSLLAYVLYSLSAKSMGKLIGLLTIPALLYGLLRSHWLFMIVSDQNPMIIKEAYDAGFFTINEIVIQLFNLLIGVFLLIKTSYFRKNSNISHGTKKHWIWLKRISGVFIALSFVHLLLIALSYLIIGEHDRLFYYPTLIINSIFVYWIGFVGYSNSNILFFKPLVRKKSLTDEDVTIGQMLEKAMNEDKLYKNPKLTSQQMASQLGVSMNALTKYINTQHEVNFSQYLNTFRTQEAIRLMTDDFLVRYDMEALAKEAGFNSKSSFYKVFKNQTGKTPSDFLKSINR
jgi:AraC-like DNA-binding protein